MPSANARFNELVDRRSELSAQLRILHEQPVTRTDDTKYLAIARTQIMIDSIDDEIAALGKSQL